MYEGGFREEEMDLMKWGRLKMGGTGVVVNVTSRPASPGVFTWSWQKKI